MKKSKRGIMIKAMKTVITMAVVLATVAAVLLYQTGKDIHNMTRCGCGKSKSFPQFPFNK